MLKNSVILSASVPKNLSIKVGFRIEREKFYPVPGLEPGPLAYRANALTN